MSAQAMIRSATGLNVSHAQAERAIRQRMERTGEVNRDHYLAALSSREMTELVELLVVPESWMFRDPQAFQTAVGYVQGWLPGRTQPVRILSVPCAGGEEPYSMAMALFDAGVAPAAFTIDAVDLSPVCVARARAGIYGRNAFRSKDLAFRDKYFDAADNDTYRINDAVRAQVRITQGNLLGMDASVHAGYYNVIFCRNLLIYFDKPTTANAIARLSAMLDDDGVLFAGYAEVPSFTQHGFTPLPHRYAFALKKDPAPAPAPRYATLPRPGETVPERRAAPRAAGAMPSPAAPRQAQSAPSAPPSAAQRAASSPASTPSRPAAAPSPAGTRSAPGAVRPSGIAAHKGAGRADAAIASARALADRGLHAQAADACQAALAADPHSAEAYFILGMLREQARDAREAEQYWRRCIYLQPDHYEALCHLALLAEQQGDADGAATLKARARRIYQRSNATRTEP